MKYAVPIPYFFRRPITQLLVVYFVYIVGYLSIKPIHQLTCPNQPTNPEHLTRVAAQVVQRYTEAEVIYLGSVDETVLTSAFEEWSARNTSRRPALFIQYDEDESMVHLLGYYWVQESLTEASYRAKYAFGYGWSDRPVLDDSAVLLILNLIGQATETQLDVERVAQEIRASANYHLDHIWATERFDLLPWLKVWYGAAVLGVLVLWLGIQEMWQIFRTYCAVLDIEAEYPECSTPMPLLRELVASPAPKDLQADFLRKRREEQARIDQQRHRNQLLVAMEREEAERQEELRRRDEERRHKSGEQRLRLQSELDELIAELPSIDPVRLPSHVREDFVDRRGKCLRHAERRANPDKLKAAVSEGREAKRLADDPPKPPKTQRPRAKAK